MNKPDINLKDKSIVIVTHRSIMPCIPGDDLKKFVLEHGCRELFYIKHPLLLLKESYGLSSDEQYIKNGKQIKNFQAYHWKLPEPLLYIKDFIYTLIWTLITRKRFNLYFGINNLNAFSGLVLKKLGRIEKVIYYTIDLYPQRFSNKLINWGYHKLDKYCVRFCDETWNVSPFLVKYRQRRGMKGPQYSRQFTVPIGIWFNEIKRVPTRDVKKTKIVYVGHLKAFYGVDLAIRALPEIRKKIPSINLEIIGGGEQQEELEDLTKQLGLSSSVKFYGWKEKKEAEKLLADCALGLAPFNTHVDEKIKNADPAKIKDYMALGLPVVMTNASLNAETISKLKCGIIIDYTPESLAKAVIKLLSNKNTWRQYRENALKYIQQFDWNYLFSKNVSRLL